MTTGTGSGELAFGSTSLTLLDRVKARDPAAWKQLVDLYGPLTYYWCRRCRLSEHDSADVVQDVFASVWSSIDRFERTETTGSWRGWLRTITMNKIRDFVAALERSPRASGGTDANQYLQGVAEQLTEFSSDTSPPLRERASLVRQSMRHVQSEFEQKTWVAFWRSVIDGRSTSEIAAELGLSECSVRQAKSRVLRKLREEFREIEGL